MWQMYWKRFPLTQGLILVVCAILRFYFGRPWEMVLVVLVMMEVGALAGAWWGQRLGRPNQDRKSPGPGRRE